MINSTWKDRQSNWSPSRMARMRYVMVSHSSVHNRNKGNSLVPTKSGGISRMGTELYSLTSRKNVNKMRPKAEAILKWGTNNPAVSYSCQFHTSVLIESMNGFDRSQRLNEDQPLASHSTYISTSKSKSDPFLCWSTSPNRWLLKQLIDTQVCKCHRITNQFGTWVDIKSLYFVLRWSIVAEIVILFSSTTSGLLSKKNESNIRSATSSSTGLQRIQHLPAATRRWQWFLRW